MASAFISRRSPVLGSKWGVSSDQPLASKIGADVLSSGGNAADAAVAMCAALCVTQPSSVSLGGDAFCLFFNVNTKEVTGYNGSGRSPSALTLDLVHSHGFNEDNPIPSDSGLSLTVPGLPATLDDVLKEHGSGKFSLSELLQPSIELCETGFAVAPLASMHWQTNKELLKNSSNGRELLLPNGNAPEAGDIIKLPCMANSFRVLAEGGKEAFYQGSFANKMAESIQQQGGLLTAEDFKNYLVSPPELRVKPISVTYKGKRIWQLPPNSDGIIALIAMNILEGIDMKGFGHNSPAYMHHIVESLRLAFADGFHYNTDKPPEEMDYLLSKEYASIRRKLISPDSCLPTSVAPGSPPLGPGETVYLSAVDHQGNACSFISTICKHFGSTLVPEGCGFAMTNRGVSFSLNPKSRNVLGPSKRTFHTNMPGLLTDNETGELLASLGVMGYLAQPQGFVQVLLNMIEFGMNPQEALDQCRICLTPVYRIKIDAPFTAVSLEGELSEEDEKAMLKKGHKAIQKCLSLEERSSFGRGQVVTANGNWWRADAIPHEGSSIWCGSDPRGDGMAIAR